MASSLQRRAIQRIIDKATSLGVDVPIEVQALTRIDHGDNLGALLWVKANPGRADEVFGCCYGEALGGPERCTCWVPVYDIEQAIPVPPAGPKGIQVRGKLCGDCAFRNDSPERADEWTEEVLLGLPAAGELFWCHDGMRRPAHWEHPDGRTVPGSTADWRPAMIGPMPFRASGEPGLLCAGWAARTRAADRAAVTTGSKAVASPTADGRLCGWRGPEVDARNGRARPGDTEPCCRRIFWDEHSESWVHVVMQADRDHKAVFGPTKSVATSNPSGVESA